MKKKIIGRILFILIILLLCIIGYEQNNLYSFNGFVQNVTYNIKGTPTITINGKDYFLNAPVWQFYPLKIEKGDRMIKKSGEMDLFIIKQRSHDTINFRKPFMTFP